ncbi:MAG: alginate export family protein [Minicystis sp.]
MNRSLSQRRLISAAFGLSIAAASASAAAQATPLPESIVVGAWTFRPLIEVRIRGEYRRHPFDAGGEVYAPTAVLYEEYGSTLPRVVDRQPGVKNQYSIAERSRFGLAVDRGPVTAAVTLQDARVWGSTAAAVLGPGQPQVPVFAPYEAYLDVHTRSGRRVFLRVGRQAVSWGDGRLLGSNDWSATGRSLDAARFGFQAGDFDVELLASMLATPGRYRPTSVSSGTAGGTTTGASGSLGALGSLGASGADLVEGSGAQLYGLNAVWHPLPLLNIELTGLARIVREPVANTTLTPSNTFVIDGRISGDRRGFRYAVEGAYELGKVSWYGTNRDLRAFAFAARASWETALPGHLTFGAQGAYASGDDGQSTGTLKRFDPILPDERTNLSPMSLFAWSNVIFGGGTVGVRPIDELNLTAGYHYAALAQPGGRWTDAALNPIGAAPSSTSRAMGHEIDASIKITPWRPLEIETGYGLFVRGSGAREILFAVERPATLQHWAYLQTTFRAP